MNSSLLVAQTCNRGAAVEAVSAFMIETSLASVNDPQDDQRKSEGVSAAALGG